MTTKTIDTKQIRQNIDLRELVIPYTELHRESANELAGPCPKCGGNDRFHCTDEWFMCRQCHPKRGDAIEFVMWRDGCDFKTAVAILTNGPVAIASVTKRSPVPNRQAERSPDWQRDIITRSERAHWRLMDDSNDYSQAARSYLLGRGLDIQTWHTFGLGYWPTVSIPGTKGKETAPAISIPWYRADRIVGIRYRFIEKQGEHKQTAYYGSSFAGVLFGGQALGGNIPRLSTLLICEGELNACSINQISRGTHLDTLSLGSETTPITPAMAVYAGQYARVLVWMDNGERAQSVMLALPGAYGVKSPNGQDANDLLRAGKLGGFLVLHRFQAARDTNEQRRLLYDLTDAQIGADDSSAEAIGYITRLINQP